MNSILPNVDKLLSFKLHNTHEAICAEAEIKGLVKPAVVTLAVKQDASILVQFRWIILIIAVCPIICERQ